MKSIRERCSSIRRKTTPELDHGMDRRAVVAGIGSESRLVHAKASQQDVITERRGSSYRAPTIAADGAEKEDEADGYPAKREGFHPSIVAYGCDPVQPARISSDIRSVPASILVVLSMQ